MTTRAPAGASDLRDHGIAVRNGSCRSARFWRDPKTGKDYVYVGVFSTPSVVVQLDVTTGRCRQFTLPAPCYAPWSLAFTLEGHVLVTSVCGRICRIDPRTGRVWVTANTGQWVWAITPAADGKYYIATSAECRLFRYDAETEELADLGRLDREQKTLRTVAAGADGYLYCGIGFTASQYLAYHIATGRTKGLLPKSEVVPGQHRSGRSGDGKILVQTVQGNRYRLEGGEAFPTTADFALPTLPDGRTFQTLDPETVRIGKKFFPLKYTTDGTNIFHLAAGPKQAIYASTIMPLYLLRYTPAKNKLENLGRGGPDDGEVYSFGHCDGQLYYGTYSQGLLMQYDPDRPLHKDPPGAMQWKDNPRLIAPLGRGHGRPRAMCVDSQKRVWIGSIPEYGMRHGGLGCYDTVRKKYVNHPVVIPDQSIWALAPDPSGRIIYGATTIARGSGVDAVTKEAHLLAWDVRRGKLLWKQVAIPGVTDYSNLLFHNGKLYGTTGKPFSFFCFDPQKRALEYVIPSEISGIREQSLCLGPDGNIYGITWMVLFRWRPATGQIEELYRCLGADAEPFGGALFHRGAVIINGRIYFSSGPRVMSLRLPPTNGPARGIKQ